MSKIPAVPAAFFGIVLGLTGLGACWRAAHRVFGVPSFFGEAVMALALTVWALLTLFYAAKWVWRRAEAVAEWHHPIQCCFIGLFPVATMLAGLAIRPYAPDLSISLVIAGGLGQLAFAIFRTGQLWKGERDPLTTTPVLYLPTVAGSFVSANAASAFGAPDLAGMFFGAGLLAWLGIESVIIHRLYTHAGLAKLLRPTLGIQLAPAVVGCSAYLGVTTGHPDLVAKGLLGYGLLQALVLARLLPWIMEQPFGASYWAFTFGLTALAFDAIVFVERGASGFFVPLSILLLAIASAGVGLIALCTLWLIVGGRLVPAPAGVSISAQTKT